VVASLKPWPSSGFNSRGQVPRAAPTRFRGPLPLVQGLPAPAASNRRWRVLLRLRVVGDGGVVGRGTINEYQQHAAGKLEFMQGVGAGQTVTDSGNQFLGGEHGVVQIDGPGQYHAQTDLGYGEIFLEGLKATSYSLKTDLLSLYKGNMLVDQVHLGFLGTASNFGVSQVGGSVVIHADGSSYKDGGVLLAHHA
jgi:hypothetical protein